MRRLTRTQVAQQRAIHRDNAMVEDWEKDKAEMSELIETKYTVFHEDGTKTDHTVQWPKKPGYAMMAALIEPLVGGHLERVNVLNPNRKDKDAFTYTDMFVNELGHGRPVNKAATEIYRANWMKANPTDDPESLNRIYGVAVLLHRRVWF